MFSVARRSVVQEDATKALLNEIYEKKKNLGNMKYVDFLRLSEKEQSEIKIGYLGYDNSDW